MVVVLCGRYVSALSYSAVFFFLMIRRPPRSTLDRSSAASDVYKRQGGELPDDLAELLRTADVTTITERTKVVARSMFEAVSYTHLRAHETVLDLVCRLLLEKKQKYAEHHTSTNHTYASMTTSLATQEFTYDSILNLTQQC